MPGWRGILGELWHSSSTPRLLGLQTYPAMHYSHLSYIMHSPTPTPGARLGAAWQQMDVAAHLHHSHPTPLTWRPGPAAHRLSPGSPPVFCRATLRRLLPLVQPSSERAARAPSACMAPPAPLMVPRAAAAERSVCNGGESNVPSAPVCRCLKSRLKPSPANC